jgi:hypothetical protein
MTNEEFELLPSRQTVEQLCHWRAGAAAGAFCIAWSEHPVANQHAAERSDIMRMTADWRASGLVLTFWKRHGERSHLLVQIRPGAGELALSPRGIQQRQQWSAS